MAFHPVRSALYAILFATSVVLLGLTGFRVHHTESSKTGDILTSSFDFYDAIIVELIVTSALAIMWSIWFIAILAGHLSLGVMSTWGAELIGLFTIWVMYLVGAAITTHRFSNLKWCRGSFETCRILETIKAFSWICFGFTTFLILATLWNMKRNGHGLGGAAHGRRDRAGTFPETRAADTRPVTTAA